MRSRVQSNSSREAALARRKAMAAKGKPAVAGSTRERTRTAPQTRPAASAPAQAAPSAPQQEQLSPTPQAASPARRAPQARKQAAAAPSSKSRELSKARRQALAQSGRRADNKTDRVRADTIKKEAEAKAKIPARGDCGCGCKGAGDCQGRKEQPAAQTAAPRLSDTSRSGDSRERRASKLARARRAQGANKPAGRLVAQAKRAAQANRGKAAADSSSSAAGLARQANPRLSSRELAQRVREQRSKQGASGVRKTPCASRQRAERRQGAADQTWKVGASETARGQTVTGTRADRTPTMTGDDGDLCRNVTGTEYLGAEIFRDFCQSEAPKGPDKVGKSSTTKGNTVTGNEVGRSPSVTGDEPGSCAAVTGAQYLSAEHLSKFCGADPKANAARQQPMAAVAKGREVQVTGDEKGAGVTPTGARYTDAQSIRNGRIERDAPVAAPKPAQREPKLSETLAGTRITGQRVGRSSRVTGDEPGTCQNVTGDQYVEASQYRSFCAEEPKPEAPKVGQSATLGRQRVSGTMTGRSARVTGDEPGTCQSVTGTPYAGLDQVEAFCAPQARTRIEARTPQRRATPGPRMTGIQPGISGPLTGASKGACETPTGTPYVGEDDYAEACEPSLSAAPGDSDFPQPLEISAPVVAAPAAAAPAKPAVTGTRYGLGGGHVTGPFDMATGKVTGTEQARSNAQAEIVAATPKPESAAERRSRVTGEGQTAGHKITGDDWDRGDRVTGTEGSSAKRRNPSRNGPMSAMPTVERKRNEEVPEPVSKITGASGNTDRGALITYSGGARG